MSLHGDADADAAAAKRGGRSELALRIGAAAVLIPLALLAEWLGSWFFALFAALCGALILHEFVRMALGRTEPRLLIAGGGAVVLGALASVSMPAGYPLCIVGAGAIVAFALARGGRAGMFGAAGVLYAGLPVVALVILRRDVDFGLAAVLFLLCVVWSTDTGAYFAGKSIGGPKLWRKVSPKKTWAGLVGGMACAGLVGYITARLTVDTSAAALVVLSGILALAAQGGDLLESAMKRRFRVKDSGTIIPGHGGVMDRLDGVVTAAVLAGLLGIARGGDLAAGQGLLVW